MMKKRSLGLILIFAMVASLLPGVSMAEGNLPFEDVHISDWYYEQIEYVYENGLMMGTTPFKFSPQEPTTRGQLVTVLYRIEKEPKTEGPSFSDVKPCFYYEDPIKWASKNNIVAGYGDGRFGPEDIITREQLISIFYRYSEFKGIDMKNPGDVRHQADAKNISPYAIKAMSWGMHYKLYSTKGNNKTEPQLLANRIEIANVLANYMKNIKKPEKSPSQYDMAQNIKGQWKVATVYKNDYDTEYENFNLEDEYVKSKIFTFNEDNYSIFTPNSDDGLQGTYKIVGYDPKTKTMKLKVEEEQYCDEDYVNSNRDYFFNSKKFTNIEKTQMLESQVYKMILHTYYKIQILNNNTIRFYFSDNKVLDLKYIGK